MKKLLSLAAVVLLVLSMAACGSPTREVPSRRESISFPSGESLQSEAAGPDASSDELLSSEETNPSAETLEERFIQIQGEDGGTVLIQLNSSSAAKSLWQQLPLTLQISDYAGSEKIFYPPDGLDLSNAPLAEGPAGTLAYYAPWSNVALFYGECGGAPGLYALGETVSGGELISSLGGNVMIREAVSPESTLALPQDGK